MAKTRYNAVVARPGSGGNTFWHRIGTAFENAKGYTVYLDSLPIPDPEDGKVKFMLFEVTEDDQRQSSGGGRRRETTDVSDDEVPF